MLLLFIPAILVVGVVFWLVCPPKNFTNEQLLACLSYDEWRSVLDICDELDLKLSAHSWNSTWPRLYTRLDELIAQGLVESGEDVLVRKNGRIVRGYRLLPPSGKKQRIVNLLGNLNDLPRTV